MGLSPVRQPFKLYKEETEISCMGSFLLLFCFILFRLVGSEIEGKGVVLQ